VEEQLEATTRATTDGDGTSGGGKGGFFLSVWEWAFSLLRLQRKEI
jgi:hypothetical protein